MVEFKSIDEAHMKKRTTYTYKHWISVSRRHSSTTLAAEIQAQPFSGAREKGRDAIFQTIGQHEEEDECPSPFPVIRRQSCPSGTKRQEKKRRRRKKREKTVYLLQRYLSQNISHSHEHPFCGSGTNRSFASQPHKPPPQLIFVPSSRSRWGEGVSRVLFSSQRFGRGPLSEEKERKRKRKAPYAAEPGEREKKIEKGQVL